MTGPSFKGLSPKSAETSRRARASSRKRDNQSELILQRELVALGLAFRKHQASLPGCPDFVFPRHRVVVFVDGDFWHGRRLGPRLARLRNGHNADYWAAKILRNVQRDRAQRRELRSSGWAVVRIWESDLKRSPKTAARKVLARLRKRANL